MKMNQISRTIIVSTMAIVTIALCYIFPNAQTTSESGLVMWLPSFLPEYEGQKLEVSEMEKKWLPDDTTQLKMSYAPQKEDEHGVSLDTSYKHFSATLILAGSDRRSLHRPEVCMVGQGWTIMKREPVMVETSGGPLEVMDLWLKMPVELEDGTQVVHRAHYVYWWVGHDSSTAHSWQRIAYSALNNIFKNKNDRWGYPSVMTWVNPEKGDVGVEEARKRAFDFIAKTAPLFQKSLGAKDREDAMPIKKIVQ